MVLYESWHAGEYLIAAIKKCSMFHLKRDIISLDNECFYSWNTKTCGWLRSRWRLPFPSVCKSNCIRLWLCGFRNIYISVHKPNMFLIPTLQYRASCSSYTPMNDNSEGQDIDEGNETEQDASGSASVSTSSLQTTQRERIRSKRKIMRSGCWTTLR